MKFIMSSRMNKHISSELIERVYNTRDVMRKIRRLKIADIEYFLNHGKCMCSDAVDFISSRDDMTGIDLVMLDHLIDSIEAVCHEISSEEIPEELRDELKASLRGIREVFSMDHRW